MKKKLLFIIFLYPLLAYSQTGTPYVWPSYNPTINYNFKDEFPSLPQPNNILEDCPEVVGATADRWWLNE